MFIISHRGNTDGKFPGWENEPSFINRAINLGFDVEIDLWYQNNTLFLGHDQPQYEIDLNWLRERITRIWIHCKNIEAVNYLHQSNYPFNYFWHENDKMTMTSRGYIWCFPGTYTEKGITVELEYKKIPTVLGVCTDNPNKFKDIYKYENTRTT